MKYKIGQVVYCGPPYDAYARVTKLRGDGTYDLSSARLEVPACSGWGGQNLLLRHADTAQHSPSAQEELRQAVVGQFEPPTRPRLNVTEPPTRPRKADWYDAEYMTLCIGALCLLPIPISPRIVLAFDYKVSTDEFASESEHKLHVLSSQFVALFSGRPGRAKELAIIYKSHFSRTVLTEENLLDNLREPLHIMRRKLANDYVQRCLGLSYAEFLSNGQDWFGAETVEKYRTNIESNALGVDMIFAGFIGKEPMLCELRDGQIERSTNFSLIGSGAYTAEPALHARQQTKNRALSQTMYNVHEAKRIGETSPGVGKETSMLVLSPPENDSEEIGVHIVTDSGGKFLEKLYRRYGPKWMNTWPILPPGALQRALLKMPTRE